MVVKICPLGQGSGEEARAAARAGARHEDKAARGREEAREEARAGVSHKDKAAGDSSRRSNQADLPVDAEPHAS